MCRSIILASKSPRRIKMMKQHGYEPIVVPSQADENLPDFLAPEPAVMYLAFLKAWDVAQRELTEAADPKAIVIGADTVVVCDQEIIGKPEGPSDAFSILSRLRNRSHQVITGVCVIRLQDGQWTKTCFYETTDVYFKDFSDEELLAYVNTDEPYDKAGGYAIQETFGQYIDHIDGDYDNVVGFPITRVLTYL